MTVIPENYHSELALYDTQRAIERIKHIFLTKLCAALHLVRVTAPLVVDPATGINDNLNGVERPVRFDVPAVGKDAEVVHSLAKWKRLALHTYEFVPGKGLVTDMNAIRRDEELDNIHSIYVDQWDWEKVLLKEERTPAYLEDAVRRIVTAICGVVAIISTLALLRQYTIYNKVKNTISDMWAGITSLRMMDRRVLFIVYTLAIWGCYFLHYYLTFFCFDATSHLGISCALVTFVVGSVAVIVPTPNGAGPWHFAVKTMLILYGVTDTDALYFVLIVHSVQTLLVVLIGVYAWIALMFTRRRIIVQST